MNRDIRVSILLVALTTPLDAQTPANWTQAIEPFEIAAGLYYVGSADLTSFLITTSEGHILIDAPMQENVELIRGNIEKLGFDPAGVEIQLASHGHFDHTGGVASMIEITGAKLLLSEQDAILVGNGGRGDFFLGDRAAYLPATADRTIGHLETVTLGGITLTAHLTPGHTRGCTSWSGRARIDGETFEWVSVCSLTALNGYQLVGPEPSYPGIAVDFCSSIEHLRSLRPDIFLASHGSFIGLDEKSQALAAGDRRAFVDPAGYTDYLDRASASIESTLMNQGQPGGCAAVLASRSTDPD